MPKNGAACHVVPEACPMTNKPQLLTGSRIIGICRFCSRADQLFFSIVFDDGWGGIGFAIVIGLTLDGNLPRLICPFS